MVERTGWTCSHIGKQAALVAGLPQVDMSAPVSASMDLVPYPREVHPTVMNNLQRATGKKTGNPRKDGYLSRVSARSLQAAYLALSPDARARLCVCAGNRSRTVTLDELQKLETYFQKIVDNDQVTWKSVVKLSAIGRQTCYDLTVDGPYTFATSTGVVVQDTMNFHAVVGDKAVQEVKDKFLPSKSLLAPGTFEAHYEPDMDYVAGLYLATRPDTSQKERVFLTAAQAKAAFKAGEISARTPIRIIENQK